MLKKTCIFKIVTQQSKLLVILTEVLTLSVMVLIVVGFRDSQVQVSTCSDSSIRISIIIIITKIIIVIIIKLFAKLLARA